MGLGTALRQGLEGYDAGTRQVERQEDRAVQKETAQLGLDDAKFRAGRRDKLAGREDTDYKRKEEQYQRSSEIKKGISTAMTTGDYSSYVASLTKYSPPGTFFSANQNKNGTYSSLIKTADGKTIEKDYKTKEEMDDAIMPLGMMLANNDPEKVFASRAAAKNKKDDRAHDFAKIDRKGFNDRATARIKAGGKGSSKYKSELLKVEKQFWKMAKDTMLTRDEFGNATMVGHDKNITAGTGTIGVMMYEMGNNTIASFEKAQNMVAQAYKGAEKKSLEMFPDNADSRDQQTLVEFDIILKGIRNKISAKASRSQGLQEPGKAGGSAEKSNARKHPKNGKYYIQVDGKMVESDKSGNPLNSKKPEKESKLAVKKDGLSERSKRKTPTVQDFSFGSRDRRNKILKENEVKKASAIQYFNNGSYDKLKPEEKRKWLQDNIDSLNRVDRKKARKEFAKFKKQLKNRAS